MVAMACGAELNEVMFSLPTHPKDEISRRGANTAVTCAAVMLFPTAAMPPEDREDVLHGSSFLTQLISRNPDWLKDWRREDAQPPLLPHAANPPPPLIVIVLGK
jgi:hypothetical protein